MGSCIEKQEDDNYKSSVLTVSSRPKIILAAFPPSGTYET